MGNPQINQPDADLMQQLLEGKLSATEETQLLSIIEQDETSQKLLEEIASDSQFRDDVKMYLGQRVKPDSVVNQIISTIEENMEEESRPSLSFLDPPDSEEYIGTFDGYQIIEFTGSGGMGIVLRAFDPKLNRIVALKVLSPQMATSVNAQKRFLREARTAASISHDHIITIHAVGESNDLPYLVMEFIQGISLQEKINSKGSLEIKEVLRIGMQIASGLTAAHGQGLIHRDVKPGNILLENSVERVKITDFGLARMVDDGSITRSGMVTGTPEYMAPEQAKGEPLDARADLFSLGSVLHVMCTGESPFRANSLTGTIRRVCDETPKPIREFNPDVPNWLVDIVTKLHEKSPDERYQTAGEVTKVLANHLTALQQGKRIENDSKPSNKLLSIWLLFICGILLLTAGLFSGNWMIKKSPKEATVTNQVTEEDIPKQKEEIVKQEPAVMPSSLNKNVTLKQPYTPAYKGAGTDKLSVQYAVMDICQQIGMGYEWDKSQKNTTPVFRSWVRPNIVDLPAKQALTKILSPLGLTYAIDGNSISLQRAANKHVE